MIQTCPKCNKPITSYIRPGAIYKFCGCQGFSEFYPDDVVKEMERKIEELEYENDGLYLKIQMLKNRLNSYK
jgi:ssDNA-binding Zn-finger/Zn-ribbon topoisomerase 1